MKDVLDRIQKRMEAVGLSPSQVSRHLGKRRTYMYDVLNGKQGLPYPVAHKLAVMLDMPLRDLGHEPLSEERADRQLIVDAEPFNPPKGHWLAATHGLHYVKLVRNVLDQHPKMIKPGDIVGYRRTETPLASIDIGTIVIVGLEKPSFGNSSTNGVLIRQFIPPNKLITNSSDVNQIIRLDDTFTHTLVLRGVLLTVIKDGA